LHLKEKPGSMAALFFTLGSLAHAESSPQTARTAAP
jgi:hypothetical protein